MSGSSLDADLADVAAFAPNCHLEVCWEDPDGDLRWWCSRRCATPSLFAVGSLSKPVTAAAAIALAATGALDLDACLAPWASSRGLPPSPRWTEVTVRRLLSHTAGFQAERLSPVEVGAAPRLLADVLAGRVEGRSPPAPIREPGAVFEYSNPGYAIAEQLIADAAGTDFARLVADLVLQPCGMASSGYEAPPSAVAGHVRGEPVSGWPLAYVERGAGGLWASVVDVVRFATSFRAAACGAASWLPAKLAIDALTATPDTSCGLGWFLVEDDGARRFEHSGSVTGCRARVVGLAESTGAIAAAVDDSELMPLVTACVATVATSLRWQSPRLGALRQPGGSAPLSK